MNPSWDLCNRAQAGFAHSFTTVPAVCDLAVADGLALPRLDTNDLPKSA